jgi:hypothetical protein
MELSEEQKRKRRIAITIALIIALMIILLMMRGCPACARLMESSERAQEDYPTEQTIARARLLSTHDFDCLVFFCTNDCAGNETNETQRQKSREECRAGCALPEMIEPNAERYPQCRKGAGT